MMLPASVLFLTSCCVALGDLPFIDFRLTRPGDPNHLTLECFSPLTGDVDPSATIFFFNSTEDVVPHDNVLSGETWDVTPDNEAFLRCTSMVMGVVVESIFVAIAGKCTPTNHSV
jgi:hypothetical protein